MDAEAKTLLISNKSNFYKKYFQEALEAHFSVLCCETIEDAIHLVQAHNGDIANIFLDLAVSKDVLNDTAEALLKLRSPFFPEVVICICAEDDNKKLILPVIECIRAGANDVLKLPGFKEEINWIARKTMSIYEKRRLALETVPRWQESPAVRQFFDLFFSRRQKGIPVTAKEMKLFFTDIDSSEDLLSNVLKQVKRPPIEEYRNVTVLVVEDEMEAVEDYNYFIQENCYKGVFADSGAETRAVLTNLDKLDIVILDVGLKDITGNELIPEIKSKFPDAEIIMMTAFGEYDLVVNSIQNGAFDFLVKSESSIEILGQKIMQALQKKYFEQFLEEYSRISKENLSGK